MKTRAEDVIAEDTADEAGADAAVVLDESKPGPLDSRQDVIRRTWIVPAIIGSANFMQTLNANSISNALPAMAQSFNVDTLRLNVAITSYMLAAAVFLPISGWLADRFGARRIFLIAIVLFALSSAACGLVNSLPELIFFRLLQGCAGAMMAPVGRLVLLRSTPKHELVNAMAVLTMPALLGPVLGPLLGGAIITFISWRWIFFLNLPIAIAGVMLVRAYVPDVKERDVPPIDWNGIFLTGVSLAALIFGFENLGRGSLPPIAVGALFFVGFAAVGLYWLHARRTPNPVVDLGVFRIKTFEASVVGGAFFRLMPGSMPFLLAMLLQVGFGMSAFTAGLMTFISGVGSLVMRTTAARVLRRFGFRTVLLVNGVISAVTFAIYSLFRPDTAHWVIMVALGVGGFFRSLQFTSLNGMTYADLDQSLMSRGTTTSAIGQQFMQSVSIGVAATLMHFMMQARGHETLAWNDITPVFAILAACTMFSMIWFFRLPKDAGDEMNHRLKPQA